ncbi:hypothetical protein ACFYPT_28000 [Streptomyces sp. NPDC005529]|uniref:hypothetical protein n=1 Tax=unclassified Streptomyces TaxID=2593676 RepID=UPI0033A5C510
MGMQDQFKDKAERLQQKAKGKPGAARDEAAERSPQERQERDHAMPATDRARHEAQDRFDQDFDA